MEYVHEVNEEFKENIKQMLMSPDSDNIGLALEILNHVDLSDKETYKHIMDLILDTDCGLCVSFQNDEGMFSIESPSSPKAELHFRCKIPRTLPVTWS